MKILAQLICLTVVFLFVPLNAAIDGDTREILIKKFEKIYIGTAAASPTRIPITLRLADLYAERARIVSMKELETNCTICNAGKKDRLRALELYEEVVNKVAEQQRGQVMTQMGHLYELTDQVERAQEFYQSTVASTEGKQDRNSLVMRAEAIFSIAEIQFKKTQFDLAFENYTKVISEKSFTRKGLASYRRAWCLFNTGQYRPAIDSLIEMLDTPELLTRASSVGVVSIDENFKDEVSRDLATFMAKNPTGLADAKLLYEKSSERVKIDNVTYFANELQRLGAIDAAIPVWDFILPLQDDPKKRLEVHLNLTTLQFKRRNLEASLNHYSSALKLWAPSQCSSESCKEFKVRLKNYVLDWNQATKKQPTEDLLRAYQIYLKTFSQEKDMTVYASLVARQLKKWSESDRLTRVAFELPSGDEKMPKTKPKAMPNKESLLLSIIEIGELSKDESRLQDAYAFYLQNSREKTKEVDVRYQQAYAVYKKGDYAKSADLFKSVAIMESTQSRETKLKASDLALDALALLKQDGKVEIWAKELAQVFPERRAEYGKLSRTAVFNLTAGASQSENSVEAWNVLSRFDLASASETEKIKFLKNKMVLAERLEKFSELKSAANQLLAIKSIAPADKDLAHSRLSWVGEMELNFAAAYENFKSIKAVSMAQDQKTLKLALFSELASHDPSPYYKKYLKLEKDADRRLEVCWKIVEKSKTQLKTIKKHKTCLKKDPERLANRLFDLYLNESASAAKLIESDKVLKTTSVGKALWRADFVKRFETFGKKLTAQNINPKRLARSIKSRDRMLKQGYTWIQKSAKQKDWTAQVVTIDFVAKESRRFYQELLSLPLPDGLSMEEQQQYLQLLSQQASPYEQKATELEAKLSEFWQQVGLIENLDQQFSTKTGKKRDFHATELRLLASIAPAPIQPKFDEILSRPEISGSDQTMPTLTELQAAKIEVRQNPKDIVRLKSLRDVEQRMNNQAMVSYIDSRIQTLQSDSEKTSGGANE